MFPTLTYVLKALTGADLSLPVPTFGFFMAIAFVVAHYLYKLEFKRKEKNGTLQSIIVTRRNGIVEKIRPHQLMDRVIFYCGISGLAGAFLFQKFENAQQWIHKPFPYFFQFDGMVWYGGLIAGIFTALVLARKYKIGMMNMMDMGTGPLMFAYAIGRLGCYLSGDGDWGIVNTHSKPNWLPDWIWADTFPHNILGAGDPIPGCSGPYCAELPYAVFPTALYEFIACTLIFFVLWSLRKKLQPGWLFGIYCVLNGLERFAIEQIRINPIYHIGGVEVTQAMIIAIGFIVTGMVVLCRAFAKGVTNSSKQQVILS